VKTTTWTSDELSRIEAAQELEMAERPVRVGDNLYVRAAYGAGSGWHRVARGLVPLAESSNVKTTGGPS
jgi:hypothetical protein